MIKHNRTPDNLLFSQLKETIAYAINRFKVLRENYFVAKKNRQLIDELLKSKKSVKLELGAGETRGIPGWTYADQNDKCDLTLDLSNPLPFPDNSVDMIYSSHLLEHFHYHDLLNFLKECFRILRPGGVFSAAVPNAKIYLNAYHNPTEFDPGLFCYYKPALNYHAKIDYINYIVYMDGHHRFMFDEENIVAILQFVGFQKVRLREIDTLLDLEFRDCESLYVACVK